MKNALPFVLGVALVVFAPHVIEKYGSGTLAFLVILFVVVLAVYWLITAPEIFKSAVSKWGRRKKP